MAAAIDDVLVTEPRGVHQQPVAHHPAVDEQVLPIRLRARLRRHADPALQSQALMLMLHMQRVGDEVRADQSRDARFFLEAADRSRQHELPPAVVRQRKTHVVS